jgi:hypothetical protein
MAGNGRGGLKVLKERILFNFFNYKNIIKNDFCHIDKYYIYRMLFIYDVSL